MSIIFTKIRNKRDRTLYYQIGRHNGWYPFEEATVWSDDSYKRHLYQLGTANAEAIHYECFSRIGKVHMMYIARNKVTGEYLSKKDDSIYTKKFSNNVLYEDIEDIYRRVKVISSCYEEISIDDMEINTINIYIREMEEL